MKRFAWCAVVAVAAIVICGVQLPAADPAPPAAAPAKDSAAPDNIVVTTDWPQYRGPNQDGISTETLNPVWPPEGPKLVWKVPLTQGFSSLAVSGGKAFTLITRDKEGQSWEWCVALDAATGKELWATPISCPVVTWKGVRREDEYLGGGPRSTPTINDGKVYVYSFDMLLCCFDAQTGKELWRVDVQKDYAGERPQCGSAESPVVDGDLVIVAGGGPGQSILAFNKNTGQVVWKTEDTTNQYSTPKVATIHGERQVVFYTKNDLMGISVKDGRRLWRSAVTFHGHNCVQPIVFEDRVYCGAMTDGAGVYQVIKEDEGFHSKRLWINPMNDSTCMSSLVLANGYLYGQVGIFRGSYACLDFATGKVMWRQKGLGNGSVILVGDKLVFLSQRGALILVEAKPEYKELARFKNAIKGLCYSTPAFSNGRLYIRSSKEGACYDMSTK